MPNAERGLTLIELIVVVAIIAVIAAIALPNLFGSKIAANEAAAVGEIKAVAFDPARRAAISAGYERQGYRFKRIADGVLAVPIERGKSGEKAFIGTFSGTIRYTTAAVDPNAPGDTSAWPPIGG